MTNAELIGRIVALHLKRQLGMGDVATADPPEDAYENGTARFLIDDLSAEQTAAVALAVLADAELAPIFDIKLPAAYLAGQGLPSETLTTESATWHRNNPNPDKPALLLANVGDGQEQSLTLVVSVGAPQLMGQPELWVRAASDGMVLDDQASLVWERALAGLLDLNLRSLTRLADFVLRTRKAVEDDGLPLLSALGASLPALQIPRDTTYFQSVSERQRTYPSKWKAAFSSVEKGRASYLYKRLPNQVLLTGANLLETFQKVKEGIRDELHGTIMAFIVAPSGWNHNAAALAECEWRDVAPLFEGLKKERISFGVATKAFFEERDAELLTDADAEYLQRLVARKAPLLEDEDRAFYERHRITLRDDRALKSQWDKFVFGAARETGDFIGGLALAMESLLGDAVPAKKRRLHIRCDHHTKRQLKGLNVDAGLFFAGRYKGLPKLLEPSVFFDVGHLWDFPDLVRDWQNDPKAQLNRSASKAALQIKFVLEMEVDLPNGDRHLSSTQLLWKFDLNSVQSQFMPDWKRLGAQPFVFCSAGRKATSGKGRLQSVDLRDVKTLDPAFGQDRGSFVAAQKAANNLARAWDRGFEEALRNGSIAEAAGNTLRARWGLFRECYAEAIKGFLSDGVACPELMDQASAFADLLNTLCRGARGDRNRFLLLRPLLQIGAVSLHGGAGALPPISIIAPWHPLRMAAMAIKARRVAGLIKNLLSSGTVDFGDPRLFFRDLREELEHPFYPEIALGWDGDKAILLALSDAAGDYSLHEVPCAAEALDTNENPIEAARHVADLVQRYLALHPHESSNLSIVLYNCDSARLPQAVVDKIGSLHEEQDVRCQVLLRHNQPASLRRLYERVVEASVEDADAYNASESARDFMARLRIGISADQAPAPDATHGPPHDIVFSQDVIAHHAQVDWRPESARPVPLGELVPPHWSRRRPAAQDDMKSVVYLCCPAQSREGWAYITALTTFLKGDWDGNEDTRLLPVRQLDFQDPRMARIFDETHRLGNWVVNYDELLDRRQLLTQQVRVIRYKQSATQGRNVIISSKAPTGLLDSMLMSRLRDLQLGLGESDLRTLTQRFKDEAGDVSGDIVLRAAKRGRNASELMGIVLSRFLIRYELGKDRLYGWYFLDDYADWLGQREETIADILALSPEKLPDGTLRLAVVISEAKYVEASGLLPHRKKSQTQLRDTMRRIEDAVFGAPERLDRSLWLARLSDLILDGVQFPANLEVNLSDWRRAIREGECEMYVRGYSHVFVSSDTDADVSELVEVAGLPGGYQEVFSKPDVRELVLRYFNGEDPMAVRQGDSSIARSKPEYRCPSGVPGRPIAKENAPLEPERYPAKWDDGTGMVEADGDSDSGPSPSDEGGDMTTEPDDSVAPVGCSPDPEMVPNPSEQAQASADNSQAKGGGMVEGTTSTPWAYKGLNAVLRHEVSYGDGTEEEAWLQGVTSATRSALQQFQLQAKLDSTKLTPNAALLKFVGSPSLTVDLVSKKRSEFLTTHKLDIVSVQPEPGLIAIAIARPQRRVVGLKELWARWKPSSENGNQQLVIGVREDDGELLFLSPGKGHAPHSLIAGTTGSGKSVLMQNIILGVAATNTPEQAKIILIDPKQGVDYFAFDSLPHLQEGIIEEQAEALGKLTELVTEMDERYRKFRAARAPNLTAYNAKVTDSERLPYVWLIHDEFAEWMQVDHYKNEVTALVGRLGVKARAAGIYLIFAAQRPDQNVMPMQLRANLGNRLILRVDSEGTSEIALGDKGAERLLGKGHLLAKLEGETRSLYAQVPNVDDSLMEAIVETICGE